MQKRKIIESGFGNAALGEQPKATVERSLGDSLFLEDVRKSPITHHFGQPVTLTNSVGQERSHVSAVGHLRLIAVVGVVLGPDEWHLRIGRGGNLLMHLFYGAADHVIARNGFVRSKDVF